VIPLRGPFMLEKWGYGVLNINQDSAKNLNQAVYGNTINGR